MRKNQLIELLNKIPGNPEVVLWNGLVDDYHHIDKEPVQLTLVKDSKAHRTVTLSLELERNPTQEELEAAFKCREWETPNAFFSAAQCNVLYDPKQKKIWALQGKPRGKKTYDRSGTIRY